MTLRDVLTYDRIKEAVAQYIKRRLEGERGRCLAVRPRDIRRIRDRLGVSAMYSASIHEAICELLDGCIVGTLHKIYRPGRHWSRRREYRVPIYIIDTWCVRSKL